MPRSNQLFFRVQNACFGTALENMRYAQCTPDDIDKLGSLRFATETNQMLTDFFSDDKLGEDIDPSTLSSVRKKDKKSIPSSKKYLNPDMQDAVWNLRHSASEHIPGKLSLCIGLPVMI